MEASTPGPGWYPDPNDPTTNRYWDGSAWTDSRAPIASPPPPPARDSKKQEVDGIIIAGYVLAVLMPIVGFIIGLTQINRNRHGLWVVLASVVAFIVWFSIISSGQ